MTSRSRNKQQQEDDSNGWCLIESDPGIFTELINKVGCKSVQVEEIYSFDKQQIHLLEPCYGLVFLFRWRPEKDERPTTERPNLFFAKQVITNACATQAILSILMNVPGLDLGPDLASFKDFSKSFPSDLKGLAISNSDLIRSVHNGFARPEPFVLTDDSKQAEEDDDVFHFIAYIPFEGHLWELDGLKAGPIDLGSFQGNWIDSIFPHVQKRIDRYSKSEIRFALMCVCKKPKDRILEQIQQKEQQKQALLQRQTAPKAPDAMDVDTDIQTQLTTVENDLTSLRQSLQAEEEKLKNWHAENIRRRHNYIPFMMNMLRILAEKGKLDELTQNARKKT